MYPVIYIRGSQNVTKLTRGGPGHRHGDDNEAECKGREGVRVEECEEEP